MVGEHWTKSEERELIRQRQELRRRYRVIASSLHKSEIACRVHYSRLKRALALNLRHQSHDGRSRSNQNLVINSVLKSTTWDRIGQSTPNIRKENNRVYYQRLQALGTKLQALIGPSASKTLRKTLGESGCRNVMALEFVLNEQ